MYDTQPDSQLFEELYDVQPQAIVWMRPIFSDGSDKIEDFEYAYANEEGLKYLGIPKRQLEGLFLSNSHVLTNELRSSVFEEMTRIYQTGTKSEATIFNPVVNRHLRVLRTKLRGGILVVLQDITREVTVIRQLEEQTVHLKEQKILLDNILSNSSNGISVSQIFRNDVGEVVDAQTILANDAAVRYIGLPKDIYLTKRATEIEPDIIGSPYYQKCVVTLETGEPFVMQYQMQSTSRWLELTVSKLDYNHLIQVFTDVTAVKQAQLELESAVNTLKMVFNAAQIGMFTFLPIYNSQGALSDFKFGLVNATISAFVHQAPEALEGEPGSKWFPGYLTSGVFDMYKHTFETGEPQRKEVHYTADGHDSYLDLQSVKVGDFLLVSVTDHTTVRKAQLQLEQIIGALEKSNSQLEDFAHAASHDMKEPLRKILTFSDRLKSTLSNRLDEQEARLFDRIRSAAERMALLVDDLLEFSQVSQQPQELEQVDLNEKIQRVLADLELSIDEKQAVIAVEPLPVIRGNRRQIQQLFQNIIGNALKYSKADVKPEITIRSKLINSAELANNPASQVTLPFHLIEVTDNGIGFEQEYAEQIFEMFRRLHGKAEYSGTGVGLATARKVVQNHKGHIWATSKPGVGTTFSIAIPA